MLRPRTFTGEFGWEPSAVWPLLNTLNLCGLLAETSSCGDLEVVYRSFSPKHSDGCTGKDDGPTRRAAGCENFLGVGLTAHTVAETKEDQMKGFHNVLMTPPDLHTVFSRLNEASGDVLPMQQGQKLLVLMNKYEEEWDEGPTNYWSVSQLVNLTKWFQETQHGVVVYVKHMPHANATDDSDSDLGIVGDSQLDLVLRDPGTGKTDFESLAELGVLTLPELRRRAEKRGHKMTSSNPGGGPMDDNELQLRLFAQSRCFVETQGGLMRVRACSLLQPAADCLVIVLYVIAVVIHGRQTRHHTQRRAGG
jgi:hypothetical protein